MLVADAGEAPGTGLLERLEHLDAGHLAHLGGQELGGAHHPVVTGADLVAHGRGRGREGDPHAEAREAQGKDDQRQRGVQAEQAKMTIDSVTDAAPATAETRSPTRTVR